MKFDIRKLAIKDTADYHVTDAAGNPQYLDDAQTQPVTITAYSPGTKKAAAAEFKRNEARSARLIGGMAGKTSKRTEQDEINERAQYLADITAGMNFDFPGGPVALYKDLPLGHVADGFEKWQADRGNFIDGSPTTSPSTSDTQPG